MEVVTESGDGSGTNPSHSKTMSSNGDGHVKGSNGDVVVPQKDGVRKRRRRKSSETVSIESIENYIPTPPDGGWGWVIVIASMAGNCIVDGIGYGFGVFLVPLVKEFNAPKSQVSMVGSLMCGTYLGAGPIISALTNKFGCRAVTIAGSLLASVAFLIASQSTSIVMLILTYGLMGGFGLGCMYLPCIVSVGYYFEKKRAFATGLAVCGSGIGTFLFPQLTEYLLSQMNWSGVLLIMAGIILNGCVCGALMRPLDAKPKKKEKDVENVPREKSMIDRLKENTYKNRSVSECAPSNEVAVKLLEAKLEREGRLQSVSYSSERGSMPSVAFVKNDRKPSRDNPVSESSEVTQNSPAEEEKPSSKSSPQHSDYYTPPSTGPHSPLREIPEVVMINGDGGVETSASDKPDNGYVRSNSVSKPNSKKPNNMNGVIHSSPAIAAGEGNSQNRQIRQNSHSSEFSPLLEVPDPSVAIGHNKKRDSNDYRKNPVGSRNNMSHLSSMRSLHVSKRDLARPLYRKDIFYSGSVLNIPEFQSQPDMQCYITSITSIPGERDILDGPSGSSKCVNKCCSFLPQSMRDVLGAMIDVSLLKDTSFMLICLGNILTFLGFFIPFMFLVDLAQEMGVSQGNAALLISIIGITNTVGRVIIGKLADYPFMDSLVITYVSICLSGLVTALVPFCNSFALLALNAGLFGLGVAAFVSLSSVIICDRLGLDKLTNGFGLLCMVRGAGSMAGPPLAGAMYDSTGSYDLSFYLGGLLMFAGAGCHMLLHLPCLRPKPGEHTHDQVVNIDVEEDLPLGALVGSKPQIITLDLDDTNMHNE